MVMSQARQFYPGMGQAVAERTILRKREDGTFETWDDVAHRVTLGNASLCTSQEAFEREYPPLLKHMLKATTIASGRHLQHGDANQRNRPFEVFSNCSTAATSFLSFYLLLNGSGVGRCYDDDMLLVDWSNMPNVRVVLDSNHADFDFSAHECVRDAKHKYRGERIFWFEVPDSREGWAYAIMELETMAFAKCHRDDTLIIDFSKVRPRGAPIHGMQDRPSSGPKPLMNAIMKVASLKGAGLPPWLQTLYIDHYFAECVLVGGARRSARMATKTWRDKGVIDFIRCKRPVEFKDLSMEAVIDMRHQLAKEGKDQPGSFLWSANNSVMVDAEFYELSTLSQLDPRINTSLARHARAVLAAITECSFGDGTGEPGVINVDKLVHNNEGWSKLNVGDFVGSERFQVSEDATLLLSKLAGKAKRKKYHMIVNPCGEVAISLLGAYCILWDVVPFHADTLDEATEAFAVSARAAMRVNTMDAVYSGEVKRTNRIGVGMTGVHEFAWKFFRCGFRDLINPDFAEYRMERLTFGATDEELGLAGINPRVRAAAFWMTLSRFAREVDHEATRYAGELGLVVPHTMRTVKPSGTVSKLWGVTEGWHLPSMAHYLRWVQFRNDDPLVPKYAAEGYPTRELVQYEGTTIVGFPTTPIIADMMPADRLVLAADATPEEQYAWLRLGEKYWIVGVEEDGTQLAIDHGNQISYTLKWKPTEMNYREYVALFLQNQPTVRACSIMPQSDMVSFEYQPEQALNKAEYDAVSKAIKKSLAEDIGREHIQCEGGVCPIHFDEGVK